MTEETRTTAPLTELRDAFVHEAYVRKDELSELDNEERMRELALLAHDCLPEGQQLAALFAANYPLLDHSNLLTLTGDLEAWDIDPGECTTTDALRYALTMFLIEESGLREDEPVPAAPHAGRRRATR